ncbi:DsbA family protein [Dictyobacter formicarum]|uniref:Thioredoxin domain-containing protein n=1 Tax=Dictyobacter formicarum TaxID=2778368 RepID=A0ABQ3V983_9CHLR|nr:thioredoxin domain-containing protein [Dictyobacter formicarum]GHO82685.1 hypothetical protein KSZ_06910 [Dictyobacter formicarum]
MTGQTRLTIPVNELDHSQGSITAPVTLVQYGDYECPYTRRSTVVVRAIQQQLGDQLRFVFRNFPLIEIHPHALSAALAAENAATQGKFWLMHDTIFHHQHTLQDEDLARLAAEIGLDLQQYERDMVALRNLDRVEKDREGANRAECKEHPRFSSMGACISVPGSRTHCLQHSKQRARDKCRETKREIIY